MELDINIEAWQDQGKRAYQEDCYFAKKVADGLLMGVFDGHGGESVSYGCSVALYRAWESEKSKSPAKKMDGVFKKLVKLFEDFEDGSTASIVFIPNSGRAAYVGVLGDSPVIIKTKKELSVSPEHNIRTNVQEREAAIRRGASTWNGYIFADDNSSGLQMSRAIGDRPLNSILDRTPDIYKIPLTEGSWVLLATDGLFDPAHGSVDPEPTWNGLTYEQNTPTLEKIANLIDKKATAKDLVMDALDRQTGDNVTAVLVRLG